MSKGCTKMWDNCMKKMTFKSKGESICPGDIWAVAQVRPQDILFLSTLIVLSDARLFTSIRQPDVGPPQNDMLAEEKKKKKKALITNEIIYQHCWKELVLDGWVGALVHEHFLRKKKDGKKQSAVQLRTMFLVSFTRKFMS